MMTPSKSSRHIFQRLSFPTVKLAAILVVMLASMHVSASYSEKPAAREFIERMVTEHQFKRAALETLFDSAQHQARVIELYEKPAESKPWHEYRNIFLKENRIQGGAAFMKEHIDTLQKAEDTFGVPAEIITAIIGVETYYGKHKGKLPVFDTLMTLAFDYPRKKRLGTSQLEQFLLFTREHGLDPRALQGSYGGAMGIPQFISSSYRNFAIDFDGDDKADIWNNPADAIGSVANYFVKHHWEKGQPVAEKIHAHPEQIAQLSTDGLKPTLTKADFIDKGVRLEEVIALDVPVKLVELEILDGHEYWASYQNFYVITRYNHSSLYAMAVFQLSQAIKSAYLQDSASVQ